MRLEDSNNQTTSRMKYRTPQLSPIEQAVICPRTTAGSDKDANVRRIRILEENTLSIFLRSKDGWKRRGFAMGVTLEGVAIFKRGAVTCHQDGNKDLSREFPN